MILMVGFGQVTEVNILRVLKTLWKHWVKLGEKLGTLQIIVFLSIAYWTIGLISAIPVKLFSDPLTLKKNSGHWKTHHPPSDVLEYMRKQGGEGP